MNILGEKYWNTLKEIQNDQGVKIVQLPSPDKFTINLDSREIIFPEKYQGENKKLFGVEGDAFAGTIYFEVDRYFDDVDLYRTTILIEFLNGDDKVRISPVITKDPYTIPNKLLFAWNLSREAMFSGKLSFAVHFYSVAQDSRDFTYSLRTLPQEVEIPAGIDVTPEDLEQEYTFAAAEIQNIYQKITEASEVLWTNL